MTTRIEGAGAGTGVQISESRQSLKKGMGRTRQRAPPRTSHRTSQWTLQGDRKALRAVLGPGPEWFELREAPQAASRAFAFPRRGGGTEGPGVAGGFRAGGVASRQTSVAGGHVLSGSNLCHVLLNRLRAVRADPQLHADG